MLLVPLRCVLLELAWPRCGFLPRSRLLIACTHLFKKYPRTCRCLDRLVVRGTWEGLLNIEATCFDTLIAGDSDASLVFVPRHLVALTVTHWTTVGKFLQAFADSVPRHPSGDNLGYSHIRHLPGDFLLKEFRPPHGA